jgi:L-cysteine desulfidase
MMETLHAQAAAHAVLVGDHVVQQTAAAGGRCMVGAQIPWLAQSGSRRYF